MGHERLGVVWAQAKAGRLPAPASEADAQGLLSLAREINAAAEAKPELNEKVLRKLAHGAAGDLCPMAALFGGVVGQEVVKAATGKFHPLFQWFYFDSLESLPEDDLPPEEYAPQVCRSIKLGEQGGGVDHSG
jgi:ubiquitin-activating enzyme E1